MEGTTALRSGPAMVSAWRFSPTGKVTGVFGWQATAGGAAGRLTKAEPTPAHAPESWSRIADTFLYSVRRALAGWGSGGRCSDCAADSIRAQLVRGAEA